MTLKFGYRNSLIENKHNCVVFELPLQINLAQSISIYSKPYKLYLGFRDLEFILSHYTRLQFASHWKTTHIDAITLRSKRRNSSK